MKKAVISIVTVTIFLFSVTTFTLAEGHMEENELNMLLPKGIGYEWIYNGFAEYGHTMSLSSINNDHTEYGISGQIHDMSGMKSEEELSFDMKYMIEGEALVQYTGNKIQDSKFSRIELIRTPLQVGNTWTQELSADNGELEKLKCEIIAVDTKNGHKIYTVNYNSVEGDYYEIREIKEMVGVISFEKPMMSNDTEITMNYSLNQNMSGYVSFDQFKDIDSNSWYAHYVNKLIKEDILHGYLDNTVRPNKNINVSEFTKLLLNSLGHEEPIEEGLWYSSYIERAKELNIIDEGDFENYDRPINRQEMAKMIVRATGETETDTELKFDDSNNIEAMYVGFVNTATSLEILVGYPDNTFRPMNDLTRAEASKVIVKATERQEGNNSNHDVSQELSREKILSLEEKLKDYLLQETRDVNVVVNYDSKTELIADMKSTMSENLAMEYVDLYFQEVNGEFKIIAKDGPAMLEESKDIDITQLAKGEYIASQENENMLRGRYRLEIYFKNTEDRGWIMTNRIFYSIDANGNINNSAEYEIINAGYSEEVSSAVENIKKLRSYGVVQEDEGSKIVYIGLGEKPTGGYGISIYSCVDLVNDKTQIIIKEEAPEDGEMVTQAITYPYLLVKINTDNTDVIVETMDGEIFSNVNN